MPRSWPRSGEEDREVVSSPPGLGRPIGCPGSGGGGGSPGAGFRGPGAGGLLLAGSDQRVESTEVFWPSMRPRQQPGYGHRVAGVVPSRVAGQLDGNVLYLTLGHMNLLGPIANQLVLDPLFGRGARSGVSTLPESPSRHLIPRVQCVPLFQFVQSRSSPARLRRRYGHAQPSGSGRSG